LKQEATTTTGRS